MEPKRRREAASIRDGPELRLALERCCSSPMGIADHATAPQFGDRAQVPALSPPDDWIVGCTEEATVIEPPQRWEDAPVTGRFFLRCTGNGRFLERR